MEVCFNHDAFLEHKPIWEVELDNGLIIYQDDDRPGLNEPSALIRLKHYIEQNNVNIVRLSVRFKDHIETIRAGEFKGIYFSKGAGKDSTDISTSHFYILGIIDFNNYASCVWFKVPELIVIDYDSKNALDPIWNKNIVWNPKYAPKTQQQE